MKVSNVTEVCYFCSVCKQSMDNNLSILNDKSMKMDVNPSPVCRLCLRTNVDSVNIWQTFQDSVIASILAKHFWFKPHKDDEMSEWLCQSCWNQTETFHHFYKRVEYIHEQSHCGRSNDWFVIGGGADDVKKEEPEQNVSTLETVLDVDLKSVKLEETSESTEQTIGSKHGSSSFDDCSDDDNGGGSRDSTNDDNDDELSNATDHEYINIEGKQPRTSSNPDRLSKKEKEDVQIRENFPMKCNICDDKDVPFTTLLEMRRHYREVHKTRGYLVCCGKKFSTRYHIMEHVLRHVNPKAYQCNQCARVCSSKFALKSHIDAVHGPRDSRTYKCSLCPSSFVKAGVLKRHVLNKHSESGKQFPCDECGKSFRSEVKLKSHHRLMHNTLPDHVCEICARRCRTKGALKRHILNQHSTTPHPKIQCSICGTWLTKSCLKRHMQSMHDEAYKPIKCTLCDKLVKNKFALPNHIRTVHGGRRHQCVQCEKAFKTSIQLKEHVACHTGESLYNCPYCVQKFKANANFFAHRRRKHLAEYLRDRDASAKVGDTLQKDGDKTE